MTWTAQKSALEFSYSEIMAVAPWKSSLMGVGDTGIPDEPIAAVWESPAGWIH